ncbi:MAG: IPT/TIG domain-containing protein [Legionellales bacterium]|nr:IPT/TIG domain-containing protein [Legionellales bacterium]
MKAHSFILRLSGSIMALGLFSAANAGSPLWTFTPLTATTLSVPSNDTARVQYTITNQSTKTHTLTMQSIQGITQLTTGLGVCGNPFILTGKASCTLSLHVNGSQLTQLISHGPIVCEQGSTLQCYRPASANILAITQAAAITDATITVTGSPLTLTTNGPAGTLTINNTSLSVTATNIASSFTGTALDGRVTETGNTCASVAPQASCTLTYTPGSTVVSQTGFPIQGSNTNAVTAAIQIDADVTLSSVSPSSGAASGGTGVTLTGVGLTGATGVTFGGTAATSVNVVSSTTVTAVTPVHAAGAVDVVITTPSGSATKTIGYTYQATAVGQSAYGGKIACLNSENNLIAATADNSTRIEWSGIGSTTNATSDTNGAENTATIVIVVGANSGKPYAAQLCSNYEIDSQGNTPCESGNTCYHDWFLPAGRNKTDSGQLNCLYANRFAISGFASAHYWSSTQVTVNNAWVQHFSDGAQVFFGKNFTFHVRCVRGFTP